MSSRQEFFIHCSDELICCLIYQYYDISNLVAISYRTAFHLPCKIIYFDIIVRLNIFQFVKTKLADKTVIEEDVIDSEDELEISQNFDEGIETIEASSELERK